MDQYLWKSFDFNGDGLDLIDALRGEPYLFFLDSSQHDPGRGRYSLIGFDPFEVFTRKGQDALDLLKEKFDQYASEGGKGFSAPFSPLTAGLVGCLSYDYGLHQERIKVSARDDLGLPDAHFGFYDCVVTIDHFAHKLYVTSSGLPEKGNSKREKKAARRLESIIKKIGPYARKTEKRKENIFSRSPADPLVFDGNFSKEDYLQAVDRALEYIACGDIYQVNLSQRFSFDVKGRKFDPLSLYASLRDLAPAPFGGYIDGGDFSLISHSPERFLHLHDGIVQTRPMKGTRPRGADPMHDRQLRGEIENSAKEKAELLMITDLLRNDLGRACAYGSVKVKEMRAIEEYEYVFQATSTVEGVLDNGKDGFDLIRACFPGGSVTGCPKIRAMEIIEELEPTRRGMYTGSMGYMNFDGNMDMNILIRTVLSRRDKLYFQVGGGIVADSVPEKEYEETLIKASAMRKALDAVFRGKAPA